MKYIISVLSLLVYIMPVYSQWYPSSETVKCEDGTLLHGTLIRVEREDMMPSPLAVVVAGSGATDRDGNSGQLRSDAYKMLCERLAQEGISSFRYDKRGVGASSLLPAMKEENLTIDTYAYDLRDVVKKYASSQEYAGVYIVGHSEGALLALLASQDNPSVAGVVSLCGAGRNMADVLKEQIAAQQGGKLTPITTPIIDSLHAGKTVDDVPLSLYSLFRPSVQPFIISTMKYDPSEELKKLSCPVLIISGDKDLQVKKADYDALREALPSASAVRVEGMSHVLKHTDSDNMQVQLFGVYMNPSAPLSENLVWEIKKFIK